MRGKRRRGRVVLLDDIRKRMNMKELRQTEKEE